MASGSWRVNVGEHVKTATFTTYAIENKGLVSVAVEYFINVGRLP